MGQNPVLVILLIVALFAIFLFIRYGMNVVANKANDAISNRWNRYQNSKNPSGRELLADRYRGVANLGITLPPPNAIPSAIESPQQTASASIPPRGNPASTPIANTAMPIANKAMQQAAAPRKSFCPNCGKELPAGAKFCNSCGTPVRRTSFQDMAAK